MSNESTCSDDRVTGSPEGKVCLLRTSFKACCCTCKHRLTDYHHCTTTGQVDGKCVCSRPRGFVCTSGLSEGIVHSGWSEHGLCELHEPMRAQKELTLGRWDYNRAGV